jgi:hypothetical protein
MVCEKGMTFIVGQHIRTSLSCALCRMPAQATIRDHYGISSNSGCTSQHRTRTVSKLTLVINYQAQKLSFRLWTSDQTHERVEYVPTEFGS